MPRKKIPTPITELEKAGLLIRIRGKRGRSTEYILQYSETSSAMTDVLAKGDRAGELSPRAGDIVSPCKGAENVESVPPIGALTAQDIQQPIEQPIEQPTRPQQSCDANLEVRRAFDRWNCLAKECELPVAKMLSKKLGIDLRACLLACGGIDGWNSVMDRIRATPFLLGRSEAGWRPGLDWVCRANNFAKIVNGNYEDAPGRNSSSTRGHAEGSHLGTYAPPSKEALESPQTQSDPASLGHSTEITAREGVPPDHKLGDMGLPLWRMVGAVMFFLWIRHLTIETSRDDALVIGAPSRFMRDHVENNYADSIIRCWNQAHPTARLPLGAIKFVVRS